METLQALILDCSYVAYNTVHSGRWLSVFGRMHSLSTDAGFVEDFNQFTCQVRPSVRVIVAL